MTDVTPVQKTPEEVFAEETKGFIGYVDPNTPAPSSPTDEPAPQASEPAKETPAADTVVDPAPKHGNRVQSRIDRLTKEKNDLRRENEELKAKDVKPDAGASGEPEVSSFENYDEYLAARDAWRDGRKPAAQPAKVEAPSVDPETQDALAEVQSSFPDSRLKYPDFDAVIDAHGHVASSPEVLKALAECDEPGDVAYYLCSNIEEAQRIAAMRPAARSRAIVAIEAKIAAIPQVPTKKLSNAPPPITPVGSGGDLPKKDPASMTMAEFEEWDKSNQRNNGRW